MLPNNSINNRSAYPGEYRLQNQFLKAITDGAFELGKTSLNPKTQITDTENYYKVELTQPGLKRENLFVSINDEGNLRIMGCNFDNGASIEDSGVTETFISEITLPENVDPSFSSAACHSGTLSIFFTKSDRPITKRPIDIVVY
ncbi:MAG TPA: Hsp20/alpha crystallin family protein [Ginsengibacter sp.]|nr:Hsp20/alpha crystallin family protein [Ginsengibacter sp.]HRP18418.1 Hsp20/alpha crystallin family protein [Ginsengibacter sp.]HRP44703.1 Hsp20/alpha crystallin family protein [Ginsengibacter sp.]